MCDVGEQIVDAPVLFVGIANVELLKSPMICDVELTLGGVDDFALELALSSSISRFSTFNNTLRAHLATLPATHSFSPLHAG